MEEIPTISSSPQYNRDADPHVGVVRQFVREYCGGAPLADIGATIVAMPRGTYPVCRVERPELHAHAVGVYSLSVPPAADDLFEYGYVLFFYTRIHDISSLYRNHAGCLNMFTKMHWKL